MFLLHHESDRLQRRRRRGKRRRKKEKVGEEERRKMEREHKEEKLKDRDKGQEAFFSTSKTITRVSFYLVSHLKISYFETRTRISSSQSNTSKQEPDFFLSVGYSRRK